ncbi:unnamed protein product [Dovyalis caffra]|uniref:SAP domain-containing protein n=1 Tax=Dovyalis caffra TaxID=77055 RepID=A0AAV1RJS0_9ROSI|nr:unnamed protein product [Dovyalis caffra]
MESSSSRQFDSNPKPAGASKFLTNLPSRGFLSSTVSSSNPFAETCLNAGNFMQGGMRVYICEHDTSPPVVAAWGRLLTEDYCSLFPKFPIPESQQIKTNQTNILIRSLQLNKHKGDSSSKDLKGVAATEGSRKRAPERALDSRASSKRGNNQIGSRQEGSDSRTSDKDYYSLTVERLRALLKERGLSPKGKKASAEMNLIPACVPSRHKNELAAVLENCILYGFRILSGFGFGLQALALELAPMRNGAHDTAQMVRFGSAMKFQYLTLNTSNAVLLNKEFGLFWKKILNSIRVLAPKYESKESKNRTSRFNRHTMLSLTLDSYDHILGRVLDNIAATRVASGPPS